MRTALLIGLLSLNAHADVAISAPTEVVVGTSAVAVEQGGRTLPIKNGQVRLKRAPFVLRFVLPVGEGILVHAWMAPEHYERARSGRKLDEAFPFEANGMADHLFNKGRDLFLDAFAYNYWYFNNRSDHRFDSYRRDGKRVVGRRTIERLWNVSERSVSSPIAGTAMSELYLVFLRADGAREISRGTLALIFEL